MRLDKEKYIQSAALLMRTSGPMYSTSHERMQILLYMAERNNLKSCCHFLFGSKIIATQFGPVHAGGEEVLVDYESKFGENWFQGTGMGDLSRHSIEQVVMVWSKELIFSNETVFGKAKEFPEFLTARDLSLDEIPVNYIFESLEISKEIGKEIMLEAESRDNLTDFINSQTTDSTSE